MPKMDECLLLVGNARGDRVYVMALVGEPTVGLLLQCVQLPTRPAYCYTFEEDTFFSARTRPSGICATRDGVLSFHHRDMHVMLRGNSYGVPIY